MLIRITWGLVLLGLGLVIGGFLTTDSNVLLILAIAVGDRGDHPRPRQLGTSRARGDDARRSTKSSPTPATTPIRRKRKSCSQRSSPTRSSRSEAVARRTDVEPSRAQGGGIVSRAQVAGQGQAGRRRAEDGSAKSTREEAPRRPSRRGKAKPQGEAASKPKAKGTHQPSEGHATASTPTLRVAVDSRPSRGAADLRLLGVVARHARRGLPRPRFEHSAARVDRAVGARPAADPGRDEPAAATRERVRGRASRPRRSRDRRDRRGRVCRDGGDRGSREAPGATPPYAERRAGHPSDGRGGRLRARRRTGRNGGRRDDAARTSKADEAASVTTTGPARRDRARNRGRRRRARRRTRDGDVAEAEPPLAIEMPPPRKAPRSRRRAASPPPRAPATPSERLTAQPAGLSPPGLSPKVWVIPGRSRYHTQDCRFAKGDDLREVTEATAQRRGYVACNVCKPGSGN